MKLGGRARRIAWGGLDQALSSLTNFLLAVLVARSVGVEEFGAFSLAFATYLVFLVLSRAVATEPLTIRYSFTAEDEWRKATSAATGTAIAVGVVGGIVCVVAGLVFGGIVGSALVVMGIGLTPLLLQDAWRICFFAATRGRSAFANDLAWTIALILAALLVSLMGGGSMEAWIAAWAAAGAVGSVFGMWQARTLPRPRLLGAWLREHSDLAPRLIVEGIILSGTGYVTIFAVSLTSGLNAVAAVRAAQVLMNATHIAIYGIQLFAVPEGVSLARRSREELRRFCILIGSLLFFVAAAWGALLLVLPDEIGRALMGETWDAARTVILPMAIMSAALGFRVGAFVGLRALALVRDSLRARTASSLAMIGGGVAGAQLAGAVGAAWGMALGAILGSVAWWYLLRQALARHESPRREDEALAGPVGEEPIS